MAPVVGLGWSKQQQWKSWMMAMSRIEDVQGGRATPYFSRYGPGGQCEALCEADGLTAEREVDLHVAV